MTFEIMRIYVYPFLKGQFSHGGYSGGEQMGNCNIWPRIIQKILNFNLQFFSKQFVGFFFYRFGEKNAFILWAKMQIFLKNWA